MLPPPTEQALNALLARKEEEWRALQAQHSQLREAALQDAQRQLEEAQGKLRRLREDFVYNLQVLEERDRELEHYDAAFARARGLEEARQAEVSELKIEVAKLRQALAGKARRVEDLQQQSQQRLQEHRLELERVHSDRNSELDQQREQYGNLKWKLERRLEELDSELALQRQELLQEFESEMQKREHAFRLQADSMSNVVLAHELKIKLLNKELVALREAGVKAAESLQSAEAVNAELEDRLQHRDWELRDLAAVKDARIKDLEGKLHSVQLTKKKEEETFRRKHEELDRLARERDTVLMAAKSAHAEQLQAVEARALELQVNCENLEVQLRRAEWRQADTTKEKDAAIDKLREDASALKSGWDAQIAQLSKEMISKDLQVQALQEEEVKLKAQLARCQQDIGRYKQQLSLAVEREQSLERDKVQLELDWQRRCEGVEREQYRRAEDLIQGLTAARDQVAAKLQETERVLCGQEVVLKAVTRERDQAVQALRTRGLHPEEEAQMLVRHQEEEISKSFPSTVIQQLQEQNTSLRNVIAQMRKEMETLSDQILPSAQLGGETSQTNQPDPKAAADSTVPDYVLALEAEMRTLKHKLKTLEEQLEDVLDASKTTSSCAGVQPSVLASTDTTGGAVPVDGPSTGLALQRLGDRAHLLSSLVAQLRQKICSRPLPRAGRLPNIVSETASQVLREPLDMDTIQRELPHELDQVHLEVLQLRKQVAEIEKHLRSAQKEGGGASGRQQPLASDTEAVGGEGPARGGPAGTEDQEAQPPQALSVPRLQRKLKEAARKILRLHLEKEQLLELGNRLRAELGHLTGKLPHHPLPTPEAQGSGEAPDARLGPLQPRLTTQDSKNAKKECFSERSGESQARLAQTVCRRDAEPGCTAGPGLRQHRISTVTCRSAPQKENQSPKPRLAQEFQEENGHHTQRSSSLASSSLQDTWKLLDLGSSPSGLTSQDDSPPEHPAPPAAYSLQHPEGSSLAPWAAFAVEGMKMEAQARGKPARHPRAHPAKPKGCQRPPKIRNYNSKD
ncbi:coiled-coil domain-containing protein 57 isoform X1 [Orcinus orca]|uniref:coiled-coil domain-containing protein 57 isoform X1 n=2 Tax=Orcinus orca TaxID=9733 RepID=UPI00211121BD|nr:coiled-coil domain-containing protein 57 isoform X1 [Orcinus orca]XP_049558339.1 coiled-coil domain-containing protein 57 isoform X1 [Orcinus orca]XP_049558340.1 coiled-coil domain-containing protein 57 isoform X1 [Orcinus orca]XP_049558341.1 coiled-coil domain-containing protein 57 isoform X1 [Orcinus orca]XP_049558342.1 coiled-coil domain-containing protein 57 isoform X1 [Orcinus orca]